MNERPAFIELYRAASLPEAHMLRLLLEEADIDVRLENESLQGALGEAPLGWTTAPRVLIAAQHESEGRRILQEFLAVARETQNPYRSPQVSTNVDTELKGLPPIAPLEISRREAWFEVTAILMLVAAPGIIDVVTQWLEPGYVQRSYWLEALSNTVYSVTRIVVAIFIICRTGSKPEQYGWTFRWSDLAFGVLFWTVTEFMTLFVTVMGPPALELREDLPIYLANRPQGPLELVLMAASWAAYAWLVELTMRAYLVSRLSSLLGSRLQAILLAACAYTLMRCYHGPDFVTLQFAIALAFGALYVLLPRVWPLAIGHTLYMIRLDLTP